MSKTDMISPENISWGFRNSEYQGLCATDEVKPEWAILYNPTEQTLVLCYRVTSGWERRGEKSDVSHSVFASVEDFVECIREGSCARHDWTLEGVSGDRVTVWNPVEGVEEVFEF